MLECRARNLPVEPGHHHIGAQIKKKQEEAMPYSLCCLVGSRMYLMVRPIIYFAIGQFSQFHEYHEPNHL